MKNIVLILTLFFSVNFVFSQINIGEVGVSNFPKIDFSVSDRNPAVLDKNAFNFTELVDGQKIKSEIFDIKALDDTVNYSNDNKCVLILWEVLARDDREEQNSVFFNAITESLEDVINEGDQFKIVTFALPNQDMKLFNHLNADFTDDASELIEALNSFVPDTNVFTNKSVSDIYRALQDGIEQLVDLNTDLPKSILLLSEEKHNSKPAGVDLRPSVVSEAQKAGIIINTIKYNRTTTSQNNDSGLAKETYGISEVLSSSDGKFDKFDKKKSEATKYIQSILNNTVKRSLGTTYNVSLELNNQIKDGKDYTIELKINNANQIVKINYQAPGNWFIAQYQENPYLVISILVVIFLVFIILIYFLLKKRKKNKLKRIERAKLIKGQQEEISSQKSELLDIKNKQEQKKKEEEEENRIKKEKELIKEMLSKGGFPVFKFTNSKGSKKFEINKPIITVGRDEKSNICIDNNNISRHHFSIIFENENYKVVDNNSTNGIILNGKKVKEALLNNTDIIEIADVSFTFFK